VLFAALHFALDPLLVALIVFAAIAAIGCAHALANARKEGVKKAKAFYRVAKMCHDAGATHHEKYYLAKATGDLFEAVRQTHELEELSLDTKQCQDILDKCSIKWLEHETLDPQRRQKIVRRIQSLEKHHHGDEVGAIAAAIAKELAGVKEQAIVPTGDGKTVTVPLREVHHHHYEPAAVQPAPVTHVGPAPATATTGHAVPVPPVEKAA
jgi:hypothetical protein